MPVQTRVLTVPRGKPKRVASSESDDDSIDERDIGAGSVRDLSHSTFDAGSYQYHWRRGEGERLFTPTITRRVPHGLHLQRPVGFDLQRTLLGIDLNRRAHADSERLHRRTQLNRDGLDTPWCVAT